MSNEEKSVEMMPKSNGPLAISVVQSDAINTAESTTDEIKVDIKRGSNNKKNKDKHKNKDETKTNINNNNNNSNNKNSKAKFQKVNSHENGLDVPTMPMTTVTAPTSDMTITKTDNNDEDEEKIRAVGEELLKRLQCNGTSISVRKSTSSTDNLTPKQTASAPTAACVTQSENVNPQLKSKPLNNNNNKKNNNNNNSSRAHDKNCQNQSRKPANNVNSSNNCTDIADAMQIIQCNGTHIEPTEINVTTDRSTRPEISCATLHTADESLCSKKEMAPSCSRQAIDNEPSTSSATMPVEMEAGAAVPIPKSALSVKSIKTATVEVTFKEYENELQMPDIMRVIQRELSEPYSIYTYRYFIHNWPKLCFLAMDGEDCIGAIVCKLDIHRQMTKRGYIAMLAVDAAYRKLKVGTTLVQKAIEAMLEHNADEVVLETEITNIPALRLYENLGFVRDKRLFDYYLNGVDALRLKLWFK